MSSREITRRALLKSGAVTAASAFVFGGTFASAQKTANSLLPNSINPRWYGFNLLEYFSTDTDWMKYFPYKNDGQFKEDDFRWIHDWGFNWVRLPMDYRFWTDSNDLAKIRDKDVAPIDRAIKLGQKHKVHVNISLHRAPGECILDIMDEKVTGIHITKEKTSVYSDRATLDAFAHQWRFFAKRYKGIPSDQLSFNLVNEPIELNANAKSSDLFSAISSSENYIRVAREAISAIRSEDPQRLIVTDGYKGGGDVIPELYDTRVLQSCHDYHPIQLTHYHNEWARPMGDNVPLPTWPLKDASGKVIVDKQVLIDRFAPWAEPAKNGVPIHFGEMGCDHRTPPDVVYAWYNDSLDVINNLKAGWALWNFRGPFGILDTNRPDTKFQPWHGHQLDAPLLRVLQSKMLT
jgi:endoglucanase